MTGIDHGELNMPMAKRYGRGGIDAAIDRYKAEQAREARREQKAIAARRRAERQAEQERPKLTRDDVLGARAVRDNTGMDWIVVRVNRTTVTVRRGMCEARLPFDRIVQVAR